MFNGLNTVYQGQLAHLKDNPKRTFRDMMKEARGIETRYLNNLNTSNDSRKNTGNSNDKSQTGNVFGKTQNFPTRKLKGNLPTAKTMTVSVDPEEEPEDLPEEEDSESEGFTSQDLPALNALFAKMAKGPKQPSSTPKDRTCHLCGSPDHFMLRCPELQFCQDYLKVKGKTFLATKGGSSQDPPKTPIQK